MEFHYQHLYLNEVSAANEKMTSDRPCLHLRVHTIHQWSTVTITVN